MRKYGPQLSWSCKTVSIKLCTVLCSFFCRMFLTHWIGQLDSWAVHFFSGQSVNQIWGRGERGKLGKTWVGPTLKIFLGKSRRDFQTRTIFLDESLVAHPGLLGPLWSPWFEMFLISWQRIVRKYPCDWWSKDHDQIPVYMLWIAHWWWVVSFVSDQWASSTENCVEIWCVVETGSLTFENWKLFKRLLHCQWNWSSTKWCMGVANSGFVCKFGWAVDVFTNKLSKESPVQKLNSSACQHLNYARMLRTRRSQKHPSIARKRSPSTTTSAWKTHFIRQTEQNKSSWNFEQHCENRFCFVGGSWVGSMVTSKDLSSWLTFWHIDAWLRKTKTLGCHFSLVKYWRLLSVWCPCFCSFSSSVFQRSLCGHFLMCPRIFPSCLCVFSRSLRHLSSSLFCQFSFFHSPAVFCKNFQQDVLQLPQHQFESEHIWLLFPCFYVLHRRVFLQMFGYCPHVFPLVLLDSLPPDLQEVLQLPLLGLCTNRSDHQACFLLLFLFPSFFCSPWHLLSSFLPLGLFPFCRVCEKARWAEGRWVWSLHRRRRNHFRSTRFPSWKCPSCVYSVQPRPWKIIQGDESLAGISIFVFLFWPAPWVSREPTKSLGKKYRKQFAPRWHKGENKTMLTWKIPAPDPALAHVPPRCPCRPPGSAPPSWLEEVIPEERETRSARTAGSPGAGAAATPRPGGTARIISGRIQPSSCCLGTHGKNFCCPEVEGC